jgi:hypothetical protein
MSGTSNTFRVVLTTRERVSEFERAAHDILSTHETSKSRVISLEQTRKLLQVLSLQQDELFGQALLCVEKGIYRALYVMAWAAFIDFLEQKLASDNLQKVMQARPAWSQHKTIEELRENIPEYQLIEAARDVRLLSKQEMKAIHGLLAKRNECAHPSKYEPGLNESLGFVSELLNRIEHLAPKVL